MLIQLRIKKDLLSCSPLSVQGREKEVAIFSSVRSSKGGRIGFVADERRINVGLTRARYSLLIVGNAFALQSNSHWHNLLRHARVTK